MLYTKILPHIHRVLAFVVIAMASVVMFGWVTKNPVLIQLNPLFAPMVFNTCVCLIVLAITLLLPDLGWHRTAMFLPALVVIIATLTLLQYALGVNLWLDHFFVDPFYSVGVTHPGRMSVSTALCFLLLGITWIFKRPRYAWQIFCVVTSTLVLGFSLIALGSYALGFNAEYGWGSFSRMAVHTSFCFALLSVAMLLQLRLEVRKVSSRRSALVPFFVLMIGILVSTFIWQLLVLRDQERNRAVTQIRLDALKGSIDNTFLPVVKAVEHMARRFSMNAYGSRDIWMADAESYFFEFQGMRRLFWADKNHIMHWVYPMDEASSLLINTRIGIANRSLLNHIAEISQGKNVSLSKVFEFRTGGRGMVLFVPIFKNNVYTGTVGASLLSEPFLSQVSEIPGYDIQIVEDGKIIFNRGNPDPVFAKDWMTHGVYSNLGTRWEIKLVPTPAHLRANTSALPGVVLLFGVSVSILLGVALSFYNFARASEAQLKKAFEFNKAGIDSASLLIIALDENTLIRQMNTAAEKMLGYKNEELAGKASPLMFYEQSEVRAFQQKMERETGKAIHLGREFMDALFELGLHRATEWTQISRTGERYTVINSTSEIRGENGEVTGYLQILEDVTELKLKEKLLAEQELKIAASSRLASLGEMAAGIAHEINNPLAIINGHAGILKKNLLNKGFNEESDVVKKVESIESVVQRIAKIIKGLRSFARETDSQELENISVEALIDDTLSFSRERFRSEDVDLEIKIPKDLMIHCQSHQISQVILNLLNNALDALQGTASKNVIIEAKKVDGGVEIAVSDNGPGVPYNLRTQIMQPFFTTKEVGKGVGLGLSISQGIIQAHNGRFYLDEDSTRTRFVIFLPA